MEQIPGHITYGATKDGKIYCLRKEHEILPFEDDNGYKRVYLTNKDGTKAYSVHRLIGLTYIENPDNKPEIDHINRNTGDNRVENLRWANDLEQAMNKGKYKTNTSGYKYIITELCPNYECYVLTIRNHLLKIKKRFDKRKYSLDDVVKFRNELLKTKNIEIID
jgi:hypothetical protein